MGQVKESQANDVVYERLLQRLAAALDEAENLAAVGQRPQQDLELRDVTPSELRLICAYLKRERQVEAAQGLKVIGENILPLPLAPPAVLETAGSTAAAAAPRCPICGVKRPWPSPSGLQLCQGCGVKLFINSDHR
ncbi:hypothetical protein [Pseudomonas sp. 5P_3.1_Bac2]|uniref:hypothetical protein n=1 Tax=Pseudomonas sp. 5P_3.1_Bac2 TaxID=2971617 RepID=UPI0021C7ED00|nr:hypothetical protein [Pseudomonas sp. 5P_3.1_Bac2]MCU1715611.1 hypothetical protein [Pseudomonas sp. 5P_3.1_Bac2]